MCQVTGAKPVSVHAVGARLTSEIDARMYNYGHLHVSFDDGSVGWYEAGWGPMMSETAFFVKDNLLLLNKTNSFLLYLISLINK